MSDHLSDIEMEIALRPSYSSRHVVDDLCRRLVDEVRYLRLHQSSHLATIRSLSQSVPLDSEVSEALNQRGALLAEVGTLRAENAKLRRDYLDVADAACRESTGPDDVVAAIRRTRRELESALAALAKADEKVTDLEDTIAAMSERHERADMCAPSELASLRAKVAAMEDIVSSTIELFEAWDMRSEPDGSCSPWFAEATVVDHWIRVYRTAHPGCEKDPPNV